MKRLAREHWNQRAGVFDLMVALGGNQDETRFVGGFVRDSLLGIPSADIDCATRLLPEVVLDRVKAAGFKAVPTGIAHGTVTAILPSGPVEITTLRRDVSTDGRRATVAYTDDWREDAARRDFTINALFADMAGKIYDYFGGEPDLEARHVRFIGNPLTRIAEDHLRILRFFRFHARFSGGQPDEVALTACTERARDLMALSRERIADELLKLLALPDPSPTLEIMVGHNILRPILPEIGEDGPPRVAALIAAEQVAQIATDPLRRLAALLPPDGALAEAVAIRLKLSNNARKRLALAAGSISQTAHALAYELGPDIAVDRLLLGSAPDKAAAIAQWDIPRLPIGGGALVKRGLKPGPLVAATLRAIETQWIAEDFPDADRVAEIAEAAIRKALPS